MAESWGEWRAQKWKHIRDKVSFRYACFEEDILKRYTPTWTMLRPVGTSQVARSSYFWLFFVPVVAKVLHDVASPLEPEFFGQTVKLSLSLPFNWVLLFFAALFFSVGRFIFACGCPSFIQNYRSFEDFQKDGTSDLMTKKAVLQSLPRKTGDQRADARLVMEDFVARFCDEPEKGGVDEKRFLRGYKVAARQNPNSFLFARELLDGTRIYARLICAVVFAVGGLFTLWVLCITIGWVWDAAW